MCRLRFINKQAIGMAIAVVLCAFCVNASCAEEEQKNNAIIPVARTGKKIWGKNHRAYKERSQKGGVEIAFIGDSITKNWERKGKSFWRKEFVPLGAFCYGIGGDGTQHVLWRLQDGELSGISPKLIVLMIGTNNIGRGDTGEQTAEGVKAVIDELHKQLPDAKILLMAVLPRWDEPSNPKRFEIDKLNKILAPLDDGTKVFYFDIGSNFINEDGTLRRELTVDDCHLNPKGYSIYTEKLLPKVKQLLGESEMHDKNNDSAVRTKAGQIYERQIGPDGYSTSFGYYCVSPESPDGLHVVYSRFEVPPTPDKLNQPASLWICQTDGSNHRKIADIDILLPHNSARAMWVNNHQIAYNTGCVPPNGGQLILYDIETGKNVHSPVNVTMLGPTQHKDKILFWVWPVDEARCKKKSGVYEYSIVSGKSKLILPTDRLADLVSCLPKEIKPASRDEWRFYHVKYSPDGKKLAFRPDIYSTENAAKGDLLAFYHIEEDRITPFREFRPNHYFWYDNTSIAGHDLNPSRTPFRMLRRFDLNGKYVEDLGCVGIHAAACADHKYFASDSKWKEKRGIHICKKGSSIPLFISDSTEYFQQVTREARFHQNPAFSFNGKRLYYNKPISSTLNGTFCVELTEELWRKLKSEEIVMDLLKKEDIHNEESFHFEDTRNL